MCTSVIYTYIPIYVHVLLVHAIYGLLSYALVHKVYTMICKLHFGILVQQEITSPSPSPSTPPASLPQSTDNGALIGVSVALAVLMASLVGACVPVTVCIYFRNRHSKKRIAER